MNILGDGAKDERQKYQRSIPQRAHGAETSTCSLRRVSVDATFMGPTLHSLRARVGGIEVNHVWLPAADESGVRRHSRIITHVTGMQISRCTPQLLELKHNASRAVVGTNGCDLPAVNKADAVERQHAH